MPEDLDGNTPHIQGPENQAMTADEASVTVEPAGLRMCRDHEMRSKLTERDRIERRIGTKWGGANGELVETRNEPTEPKRCRVGHENSLEQWEPDLDALFRNPQSNE